MFARSRNLVKVDSVKRKLDFDEPSNRGMETEPFRAPIWKTTKARRLDFGETDPSVRSRFLGKLTILLRNLNRKYCLFGLKVAGKIVCNEL